MKLGEYPLHGRFGEYGGRYVPETLTSALDELEETYDEFRKDKKFTQELDYLLRDYAGRPTPLYFAKNLTKKYGGARIYLKREDLLHGGAHKINNAIGQALLAKMMGKKRIIAETGAGQHGVACAIACASLDLSCDVYMGAEDIERQRLNVLKMRILGTRVVPVYSGSKTLKDAINEALRDWVTNVRTTHYLIGSVVGPHPFPSIVREFQSVIGREAKKQFQRMKSTSKRARSTRTGERSARLPASIVACVGGGSNAAGAFYPFIDDREVELVGVEAGGRGLSTGKHAATLNAGKVGVLHGMKTYVLQDEEGQTNTTHSISAGLDYPGVGPEHSFWKSMGRVRYTTATDEQAVKALLELSELEGIIPALESAHAVHEATRKASKMKAGESLVVILSGRGDKDLDIISRLQREEEQLHQQKQIVRRSR